MLADGYSHVVIEVSELNRAEAFYRGVLGAGARTGWPGEGARALALPSGQFIVLAEAAAPRAFPDTGVHWAFRAAPGAISAIAHEAEGAECEVIRYREDRPEEAEESLHLADPDGNRVQLVAGEGPAGGIAAIDHAVAQVSDIEWADEFYVEALGLRAAHRVGWATADFVRARAWGEGQEPQNMAPGTRRWDTRYRDIPGGKPGQGRKVPRPNPQLFLEMGGGGVFGIFLAQQHFQEPAPEATRGSPRVAFRAKDSALDGLARRFADAGARVEGPVAHEGAPLARSLYLRDRCGLFLEFCSVKG